MSSQIEVKTKLVKYLLKYGYRNDLIKDELISATSSLGKVSNMQISPEQSQFLELIVKIINAKNCLEIGRFTGLGTLSLARGVSEDGLVTTIDNSTEFEEMAKFYWRKAKIEHKIDSIIGQANEVLLSYLDKKKIFDLIFIDADKKNYDNYYEICLNLLYSNGVMIIDNMLWGGQVANFESDDKTTKTIHKLNQKIKEDTRIEYSLLPIADGLVFIRKK
ncbi:MAG: putative O-methyltransferase [Alphaproteobacteria bacterium MarineAlpha5_Bin9]|nr:MAG: putative O-methyltransferase [Alphaproteobacteria bacterium MarineAlpha5_Bin9]|tara:strand:- start:4505 stop:5161 length:657 start_codon:yes stop_codon:yes gene_type:complete